jgi:Ras-related protein Rab-8A
MQPTTFKVVLLGDSGVGKSTLVTRFVENRFAPHFLTTIGVEFAQREENIKGQRVNLRLWDSAGDLRYNLARCNLLASADYLLFCFDLEAEETL